MPIIILDQKEKENYDISSDLQQNYINKGAPSISIEFHAQSTKLFRQINQDLFILHQQVLLCCLKVTTNFEGRGLYPRACWGAYTMLSEPFSC